MGNFRYQVPRSTLTLTSSAPSRHGGSLGTQSNVIMVGPWVLSETLHRAGFLTKRHAHERASLNVVLSGVYSESVAGTTNHFTHASVIAKPAGESHANDFGGHGARCLLIEYEPMSVSTAAERRVFSAHWWTSRPALMPRVAHLLEELRSRDDCARLALEATVGDLIDMLCTTQRADPGRVAPQWMRRADEYLREESGPLTLAGLAAAVGRDPSHVGRVFRSVLGETVGAYARRVRLEGAASALASTTRCVSAIAQDAGFFDHSHFVRWFKRHFRTTPSAYRARFGDSTQT